MEKIKEFVKENFIWIVGGILLTTIILYLANKKKKQDILRNPGKAIIKGNLVPGTENLTLDALKIKLDECNKQYANVRLSSGVVGPCGLLQDQYNAALNSASTESSYARMASKPRMCRYPGTNDVPGDPCICGSDEDCN